MPSLARIMLVAVVALCGCSPAAVPERRAGPAIAGSIEYPAARRGDVVDVLHGERVADPYRWLEDLGGSETRAWVAAEDAVTRRWRPGSRKWRSSQSRPPTQRSGA